MSKGTLTILSSLDHYMAILPFCGQLTIYTRLTIKNLTPCIENGNTSDLKIESDQEDVPAKRLKSEESNDFSVCSSSHDTDIEKHLLLITDEKHYSDFVIQLISYQSQIRTNLVKIESIQLVENHLKTFLQKHTHVAVFSTIIPETLTEGLKSIDLPVFLDARSSNLVPGSYVLDSRIQGFTKLVFENVLNVPASKDGRKQTDIFIGFWSDLLVGNIQNIKYVRDEILKSPNSMTLCPTKSLDFSGVQYTENMKESKKPRNLIIRFNPLWFGDSEVRDKIQEKISYHCLEKLF